MISTAIVEQIREIVTSAGAEFDGVQDTIFGAPASIIFQTTKDFCIFSVPFNPQDFSKTQIMTDMGDAILQFRAQKKQEKKMTDSPKLNLRQKLIQVYTEIDHVEKAGRNNKQNYNFVRAADVLRAVRLAFAKLGIYAETNYELLGTYDIKTNSGGIMHTATVKATIRLHDADSDETMTISGLGDGADGGDKGIYKAQTGATKNALRNGSLLPDEADPEADEKVDSSVGDGTDRPQDDPPDFQEARHAAPRPAAAQKATSAAARPPAAPAPQPEAPKNAPLPTEAPSTVPVAFTKTAEPAAVPQTTLDAQIAREPGDDGDDTLPTEEEMTAYRSKFSKLGDDLSTEGKLKSSKGLPLNRKLLIFLLSITKASEAKNITQVAWIDFFNRVEKIRTSEAGLVGLAKLVNKANGIDDKKD